MVDGQTLEPDPAPFDVVLGQRPTNGQPVPQEADGGPLALDVSRPF